MVFPRSKQHVLDSVPDDAKPLCLRCSDVLAWVLGFWVPGGSGDLVTWVVNKVGF